MATLEGHEDFLRSLVVLEGGWLAIGSYDHTIKIWNLATGECVATLEGQGGPVFSLAVLEGERSAPDLGHERRFGGMTVALER